VSGHAFILRREDGWVLATCSCGWRAERWCRRPRHAEQDDYARHLTLAAQGGDDAR
jgi:hypothetical protein